MGNNNCSPRFDNQRGRPYYYRHFDPQSPQKGKEYAHHRTFTDLPARPDLRNDIDKSIADLLGSMNASKTEERFKNV